MPTYTYRCKNCSYQFEELQRVSDEPFVLCPSCKKETLVRIIEGGAGLVFKGSGFYLTDYKKSSNNDTKKPTSSKESTPEKKPESKSPGTSSSSDKGSSPSPSEK